jgi:sugar lactone lactonase YvrE
MVMKRNTSFKAIISVLIITFFSACSKNGSNPTPKNTTPTVTITSLSVNTGPYGTTVLIKGTGFVGMTANSQVQFNGKATDFQSPGPTEIYTTVPLAAGTGNVTVTVNGTTATGPVFTYQVAEVVTPFTGSSQTGKSDGKGAAATFFQLAGLTTDALGNIYVADQGNNLIRKITPDGTVSTLAGSGQPGRADGAGAAASFNIPTGIAVDASGNVYVSDALYGLIRKITPSGVVSTLAGNGHNQAVDGAGTAAGFSRPLGLAIDASGNIFVADQGIGHIRKITPAGVVTTIYGGYELDPYQIALDKAGNIYATDVTANNIKKITQNGILSTFAGSNSIIGSDIDGTENAAGFYRPIGLTIDGNGNLYVIDTGNGSIRKITPAAVVTTIGGQNPLNPYGLMVNAQIFGAQGIITDKVGNMYFTIGSEIRKISMQ